MSGKADEELVSLFFANSLDLVQVMLTKKKKKHMQLTYSKASKTLQTPV